MDWHYHKKPRDKWGNLRVFMGKTSEIPVRSEEMGCHCGSHTKSPGFYVFFAICGVEKFFSEKGAQKSSRLALQEIGLISWLIFKESFPCVESSGLTGKQRFLLSVRVVFPG